MLRRTDDLRRWFLQQESDLFRHRFRNEVSASQVQHGALYVDSLSGFDGKSTAGPWTLTVALHASGRMESMRQMRLAYKGGGQERVMPGLAYLEQTVLVTGA